MRSPALQAATRRVSLLRAVLIGVFAVLAARAAHLTLDSSGERRAAGQLSTRVALPPARGLIVDRLGAELAVTIHAPSVYVMPQHLTDASATVNALATALDISAANIRKRLEGRDRFTYIARWVSEAQREKVEALELEGVGIVREPRRAYPAGKLGAGLIGFANIDGIGVRGIEQQENDWLSGSQQIVPVERDARGRLFSRNTLRPRDAAGGDVALTIDATLQAEAEVALAATLEATGARGGSVVSMDPTTGEILALAEGPGFDPNQFWKVPFAETRSRAFLDANEPGSTLKVFLVAAALEAGVVETDEMLNIEGWVHVRGKTIRDRRDFGPLAVPDVLRVSSNVGAVHIAHMVGRQEHHRALVRFGFGERTGTGFPSESAGLLRHWKDWTPVDQASVAYGHGLNVTPVQLAAATCALANGGVLLQPRLIAARRNGASDWTPTEIVEVGQAVRPDTASAVLGMMETVVSSDGTGRRAALRDIAVAGKTGTAQKFDPETGTYSHERYIAWFIGAVPADDPKLVIVVSVDEPSGSEHSGGGVAAPLFAEVAAAQLAHLGISTRPERLPRHRVTRVVHSDAPTTPSESSVAASKPVAAAKPVAASKPVAATKPVPATKPVAATQLAAATQAAPAPAVVVLEPPPMPAEGSVLTPNFVGETLASVRQIAGSEALTIEIVGQSTGLAVSQEPPPGTVLAGSQRRVRIRFEPSRES